MRKKTEITKSYFSLDFCTCAHPSFPQELPEELSAHFELFKAPEELPLLPQVLTLPLIIFIYFHI